MPRKKNFIKTYIRLDHIDLKVIIYVKL